MPIHVSWISSEWRLDKPDLRPVNAFVCMHRFCEHHTQANSCMSSKSMLTRLSGRADHRYPKVGQLSPICPLTSLNDCHRTQWSVSPWMSNQRPTWLIGKPGTEPREHPIESAPARFLEIIPYRPRRTVDGRGAPRRVQAKSLTARPSGSSLFPSL